MKVTIETIPPVPPPKKIILELTEDEARCLDYFAYLSVGAAARRFRKLLNIERNEGAPIKWDECFK